MSTLGGNDKSPARQIRGQARGLTLVELIVVLAIISALAGLLVAGVLRARGIARTAVCASSLRQIAIALNLYAADTGFLLPAFFGNRPEYRYAYPDDEAFWPDFLAAHGRASPDVFLCPASTRRAAETYNPVNFALNGNAAGTAHESDLFGERCGPGIDRGFAIGAGGLLSADRLRHPGKTVSIVDAAPADGRENDCHWQVPFRNYREDGSYEPFSVLLDDRPSPHGFPDAAARHNGQANVAFFDGHVAPLRGGRSYGGETDGVFLHWDGLF